MKGVALFLILIALLGVGAQITQPNISTVNGAIHLTAQQVVLVTSDDPAVASIDIGATFQQMANTIASLQSQLSAINATAHQRITTLETTVQQQGAQILTLNNQLTNASSIIVALKQDLSATNGTTNSVQQQLNDRLSTFSSQLLLTNNTANSVQQQLNAQFLTVSGQVLVANNTANSVQQQLNNQFSLLSSQLSATNTTANAVQQQLNSQFSSLSGQLSLTNATANSAREQAASLALTTSALSANASLFLTAATAAATYYPLSSGTQLSGQLTTSTSQLNSTINQHTAQITTLASTAAQFVTFSNASSTFLTQSNAATQYQPLNGVLRFADGSTQSTAAVTTLPPNLISNSFFNLYDGSGVPTGWSPYIYTTSGTAATISIVTVSAYTYCFEGPYTPTKPVGAVDTCNLATASNPFWFGVYNVGPRIGRGGLTAGGWGALDGRILKVTGTRQAASHPTVVMARQYRAYADKMLLRGWLKIISGSGVRFGTDYGNDITWTKAQTDAAPDGWLRINQVVTAGSQITNFNYVHAHIWSGFGTGTDGVGYFEFYLALPYLGIVGGTTNSWTPSIMDVIRDSQGANPFGG